MSEGALYYIETINIKLLIFIQFFIISIIFYDFIAQFIQHFLINCYVILATWYHRLKEASKCDSDGWRRMSINHAFFHSNLISYTTVYCI